MEKQNIIEALQDVQRAGGNIDIQSIARAAETVGVPLAEAAGTASFYAAFNKDLAAETYDFSGFTDSLLGRDSDYAALEKVKAAPEAILDILRDSGLRGRSGSGFPVWRKWLTTKEAQSDIKYVVCNGSEGEMETYKDLVVFTKAPRAVVEGMTICALAVGAAQGYIYVRAEYQEAYSAITAAVADAYDRGVLGHGFDLAVKQGAGAYVCGEETGLMEFLEGKRGETRLKPPFPGVAGLWGKPTVINNAETFANISGIILGERKGETRLFTVTGCVERPGVYECDNRMTVGELFRKAGGRDFKGLQIGGGASGMIVGRDIADMPLDTDSLKERGIPIGTGSLMFFDESTSAVEVCRHALGFLSAQSCGKCVPCRLGTARAYELLCSIADGHGNHKDIEELRKLAAYLKDSARCAMGVAAATPIESALNDFAADFETLCGGR